jgi:hypothetical protein
VLPVREKYATRIFLVFESGRAYSSAARALPIPLKSLAATVPSAMALVFRKLRREIRLSIFFPFDKGPFQRV